MREGKGLMIKMNIPMMVTMHPKQMEWLDWVYTTPDGRRFLNWCNFNETTKDGLRVIWMEDRYDKANDGAILNDIVGLYKEWMYNEKRGLNTK